MGHEQNWPLPRFGGMLHVTIMIGVHQMRGATCPISPSAILSRSSLS